MKTAIKICIITLISYGCDGMTSKPPEQEVSNLWWSEVANQQISEIKDRNFEIIEIEDCEYIYYKSQLGGQQGIAVMAHKGNCKNPIHCQN